MEPLSLVTLPDEIQQWIYRYVYPITDITLLPDSDPKFIPKDLTSEFNIIGNHGYALLQTCSKVCAVAKPIRDSSFTGRVNVSRVKDLIHCGFWIAQNVETICLIPNDVRPLSTPHLTLFPNLRKLIIVDTMLPTNFSAKVTETTNSLVGRRTYNNEYIALAKSQRLRYFSPSISLDSTNTRPTADPRRIMTLDRPNLIAKLDIYIHVRTTLIDEAKLIKPRNLGFTVRFLESAEAVVARAIRGPDSFTRWELQGGQSVVQDCGKCGLKSHPLRFSGVDDVDASDTGDFLSGRRVVTTSLDEIPESLRWLRQDGVGVGFEDVI